ncbi:type III polyketide synthase [Streptomyces wuyuanensis]|uniref:type III polyketide synthase n=1 Tax=Streptomyces wuyuanensis TaxID=1196353 RepID=UPI0036B8F47A
MPVLCKPSVAVPEYVISRHETLELAQRIHHDHGELQLALRLISRTGVRTRHLVQPPEVTLRHPGFEERNLVYAHEAKARIPAVVDEALRHAQLAANEIDTIIYVSCTGFMMPSMTAWMINNLGFRNDTRQLPIAQLGCAGGGAAINRAYDFCLAHPGMHALIVACEFCSLCYQPSDLAVGNLLADGLFGDAVAAAVVRGHGGTGVRLAGTSSRLLPGTEDWIAYSVRSTGFHFRLDPRVPTTMVQLAPHLGEAVAAQGWDVPSLDYCLVHAGGPRILDDLSRLLGISPALLRHSRATLTEYGNIAAASVLDALRRMIDSAPPREGARGLIAGFGPGITAEIALGTWTEDPSLVPSPTMSISTHRADHHDHSTSGDQSHTHPRG